jgi:hypothetical protein
MHPDDVLGRINAHEQKTDRLSNASRGTPGATRSLHVGGADVLRVSAELPAYTLHMRAPPAGVIVPHLTVLLCIACAVPCVASEPLAALLACRDLTSSSSRLACFDREAAALATASSKPVSATPAAPVSAPDSPQHVPPSETAGATRDVAGRRPADMPNIEAHIIGLSQAAGGRTIFQLDNGQVWRQLEPEEDMLAKLGDAATISRGWLGSYWLELRSHRGCKVTRVR